MSRGPKHKYLGLPKKCYFWLTSDFDIAEFNMQFKYLSKFEVQSFMEKHFRVWNSGLGEGVWW